MLRLYRSLLLSVLLLTGVGVAGHAKTEVLYGTVVVDAIQDYGIGIALDERSFRSEPDGTFDRLFILETYGLIPDEFPITIDNARLLIREDGVVATARNKALVLGFFLTDEPGASEEQLGSLVMENGDRPLAEDALFVYSGFGFSQTPGKWKLPLDSSWMGAATEATSTCTSGGTGSTACSQTCGRRSCSISCATGFYACCNCGTLLANCKCIAGGGGGGGGWAGGGGGGPGTPSCGVPAGGFCPVDCIRCYFVY